MSENKIGEEISNIGHHVSLLQIDIEYQKKAQERFDSMLDKLTVVQQDISRLLSVQDSKIEFQEKVAEKMQDLLEKRKQETDTNIKEIYDHIEEVEDNITKDMDGKHNKLIEKFDKLEKMMYVLMGGSVVAFFFIDKINLGAIFG